MNGRAEIAILPSAIHTCSLYNALQYMLPIRCQCRWLSCSYPPAICINYPAILSCLQFTPYLSCQWAAPARCAGGKMVSEHFEALLGTLGYFYVLRGTSRYFEVECCHPKLLPIPPMSANRILLPGVLDARWHQIKRCQSLISRPATKLGPTSLLSSLREILAV